MLALWIFPEFWFTAHAAGERVFLAEKRQIGGWTFEGTPISEAAERALVADQIVNGEFRSSAGEAIRVFSAKRHVDNPNEIGLFVHTPDRCWVEGGWKLEPASPDFLDLNLHGSQLKVERRIFIYGNNRELVYFGGLIDGRALPYRLDYNLSIAARSNLKAISSLSGSITPTSQFHFWERLWTSFTTRNKLSGPKHFFRISTPIRSEEIEATDRRLSAFLREWLIPAEAHSTIMVSPKP